MSWGAPKALAPFPEGSPFAGLVPPADVSVSAQVLAEPGEITRHDFVADCALYAFDYKVCSFLPAQVAQHHFGRQNH